MSRLSTWLYRISSGRVAMVVLGIFLLFTLLVLPRQAISAELSSGGMGSPDLSFYYSSDELYRMADAYGEQGRQAYLRARWTFDLLWPMVYTLFLIFILSWVYNRALAAESGWRLVNLTPLVGMLFDYLENSSTSLVMLRYPLQTPLAATLAPIFTSLKWIFVSGSFLLLAAGIAAALWRWADQRRR